MLVGGVGGGGEELVFGVAGGDLGGGVLLDLFVRGGCVGVPGGVAGDLAMHGRHGGQDRLPAHRPAGQLLDGPVHGQGVDAEPAGAGEHGDRVPARGGLLGVPGGLHLAAQLLGLGRHRLRCWPRPPRPRPARQRSPGRGRACSGAVSTA